MNPALYLSAEMMLELAIGLEPPVKVAAKHNIDAVTFATMTTQDWFMDALLRERERLRDEGFTWQAKAKLMNQEVIQDLFKLSKANGLKPETQLEFSKHLSDMTGERKPVNTLGSAGPQFQITINMPDNPRGPTNVKDLIQSQKAAKLPPMVIEMGSPPDTLPPAPAHVSAMALPGDLVGPPLSAEYA